MGESGGGDGDNVVVVSQRGLHPVVPRRSRCLIKQAAYLPHPSVAGPPDDVNYASERPFVGAVAAAAAAYGALVTA